MQAWSPFYWADYVADTAQLSLAEHGAYLLLMAHYYNTGKPLVANATALLRICRAHTDAEQEAVHVILTAYFRRDGDVYRHARIDRELAKSQQISQLRRENGRRGGLAKAEANAIANASDLLKQTPKQNPSILQPQLHKEKERSKSFVRPTLEEVKRYCDERQNGIDAAKWFDYYSANGWHVGRHSMKDWKSAVRYWERQNYGGPFNDGHKTSAQLRNERSSASLDRAFSEEESPGNLPTDIRQGIERGRGKGMA